VHRQRKPDATIPESQYLLDSVTCGGKPGLNSLTPGANSPRAPFSTCHVAAMSRRSNVTGRNDLVSAA